MLGTDGKLVNWLTGSLVQGVKILSYFGGVLALLAVDIYFGAAYYSTVLKGSSAFGSEMLLGLMLSLATTCLQIVFWTLASRGGFSFKTLWSDKASLFAAIGFVVIMVGDTLADLGFVTHLVFPKTESYSILPPESVDLGMSTLGYFIVAAVTVTMAAVNEPMLKMILDMAQEDKSPRPSHAFS